MHFVHAIADAKPEYPHLSLMPDDAIPKQQQQQPMLMFKEICTNLHINFVIYHDMMLHVTRIAAYLDMHE